jgi:hypothetical protein
MSFSIVVSKKKFYLHFKQENKTELFKEGARLTLKPTPYGGNDRVTARLSCNM